MLVVVVVFLFGSRSFSPQGIVVVDFLGGENVFLSTFFGCKFSALLHVGGPPAPSLLLWPYIATVYVFSSLCLLLLLVIIS